MVINSAPPMRIGHLNLAVADLDRAVTFYRAALGFTVVRRRPGSSLAFLSCGTGQAFDLALTDAASRHGVPPPAGHTGLDHVAIEYPTRAAFVAAYQRLLNHGVTIEDAREHGFAESIYFRDLDGNGLEIYWEYPPDQWLHEGEDLGSRNVAFDPRRLLDSAAASELHAG